MEKIKNTLFWIVGIPLLGVLAWLRPETAYMWAFPTLILALIGIIKFICERKSAKEEPSSLQPPPLPKE